MSDNTGGVSISIGSVTGGQNNIGTTNIAGDQVQNVGGDRVPTVPEVFEVIEKALPEPTPEVVPSMEISEVQEAVTELRTIAIMPAVEQDTPTTKAKMTALLNDLIPYAPQIGKGLAVFGSAALTALASSNPVISGVLAVCKMASAESTSTKNSSAAS